MNFNAQKLIVLSLATAFLACSGSKDDNKAAAPVNPNGVNLFGNPNSNFNSPSNANFNSIDIVGGKIVNRQFNIAQQFEMIGYSRASSGEIQSVIESDSCNSRLVGRKTNVRPGVDNNVNLSIKFDANGNMQMQFTSNSGVLTSEIIKPLASNAAGSGNSLASGTYVLNDQDQTIDIGPFALVGSPTASYINYVLRTRGLINNRNIITDSGSNYNLTSSGGGFRSDYSQGQPINRYQQSQLNLNQLNQNSQNVSSNNRITVFFENGLRAKIRTLRLNEQHVHSMTIQSADDVSESLVNSGNITCAISYKTNWSNIVLK